MVYSKFRKSQGTLLIYTIWLPEACQRRSLSGGQRKGGMEGGGEGRRGGVRERRREGGEGGREGGRGKGSREASRMAKAYIGRRSMPKACRRAKASLEARGRE